MAIEKKPFGKTPDGEEVFEYVLTNAPGMRVSILNYGGIIAGIETPDRDGQMADVAMGYGSMDNYIDNVSYFGCIAGRCANRIGKAKFSLDGVDYVLAANNGPNHLHGGIKGFDKMVWSARPLSADGAEGLALTYTSVDGEEGYPGTLECTVTYWLTDNNEVMIEYEATTDKATPLNLTNHSYFNLAGHDSGDILGHEIMINADYFTVTDDESIPTGEVRHVEGTPLDFRTSTPVGARIDNDYEQIRFGKGYDQNFVINQSAPGLLTLTARIYEATSGRAMHVFTTEPAVQFYSGNFLDGSSTGKGGKKYQYRGGLCLETQHYPDSPNNPEFPSAILRPGEKYTQTTIYKFSVD